MADLFDHLLIAPRDFDASLAFYCNVMHWDVISEWRSKAGVRGAVVSGGGVEVVLMERARGKGAARKGSKGSQPTLHLDIHDADQRFAAIPAGDHIVVRPEVTEFGVRWFVLKDPDGNLIAFNERRQRN